MAKLSEYIIGILLLSCCVGIFVLFFDNLNSINPDPEYSNTSFGDFSARLNETNKKIQEIQEEQKAFKQDTGLLDILGGFFTQGYQVMNLALDSMSFGTGIINDGVEKANLGVPANIIKTTLIAILIVTLVLGVVISAVVKREL